MKVGIVGAGAVGSTCLLSMVMRGSAREVVLVNRDRKRAKGIVTEAIAVSSHTLGMGPLNSCPAPAAQIKTALNNKYFIASAPAFEFILSVNRDARHSPDLSLTLTRNLLISIIVS